MFKDYLEREVEDGRKVKGQECGEIQYRNTRQGTKTHLPTLYFNKALPSSHFFMALVRML